MQTSNQRLNSVIDRPHWKILLDSLFGLFLLGSISCNAIGSQDEHQILYAVNCTGSIYTVSLRKPYLVKQRSIAEIVPSVVMGSTNGCAIENLFFSDNFLMADLLVKDAQSPEDLEYSSYSINLASLKGELLKHRDRASRPIGSVLERRLRELPGNSLQPYANEEGHKLLIDETETMGPLSLVRLDFPKVNGTVIATYNSNTQEAHVIRSALNADAKNLHFSTGGKQVIVEENAQDFQAGTNESPARTGRVIAYEVATGKVAWERMMPKLSAKGPRILCASSTGTLIIGSPGDKNVLLIRDEEEIELNFPGDAYTWCGFVTL